VNSRGGLHGSVKRRFARSAAARSERLRVLWRFCRQAHGEVGEWGSPASLGLLPSFGTPRTRPLSPGP
jgi:hypothetical protein